MRDYTYKQEQIDLAKYLKANPPQKIWHNYVAYYFDYGDFYIGIESSSELADSQNGNDEAIIGKLLKYSEKFLPGEGAKLVCENKKIEDLYIIRVFLYFTTHVEYSKTRILYNRLKAKFKSWFTLKPDYTDILISECSGGHEEITCHPDSNEARQVDSRYSNLVDTGLLVQIDGKILKAFIEGNGFGFNVFNDNFFLEPGELKEDAGNWQFIKV